ncbi:hydrogenase maturation nickel metallochaperone HypA [Mycobacterium sp. E1747]|uniref:hydrogenase maturation nickel metallochaperone HypA n=1 Tax=Mycobacterium sp. E1747 TaxID=1834128 RepID=UPI00080152E4|nr:hydrogenase maturation nickel metallochaperone HypA [Mycobacterium sp. E1747]OBH14023.1 hydrogenase expression protein HupH [Mycobacterium sp. E1747]
MHELSLCHAIAGVVKPHAAGRHVDVVRVQIGALRQVVPDSLEFCWSLVCQHLDENMVDTALELELVPAEVCCRACGQRSEIVSRWSVCCPECASGDVEVLRGNEFLVTSVDVSDGVPEPRKVE